MVEAWDRAGRGDAVDIACDGGTGRTGTTLACMAILAGISEAEVIGWVRTHYQAAETRPERLAEAVRPLSTGPRQGTLGPLHTYGVG